jgi:hypothetical protein
MDFEQMTASVRNYSASSDDDFEEDVISSAITMPLVDKFRYPRARVGPM